METTTNRTGSFKPALLKVAIVVCILAIVIIAIWWTYGRISPNGRGITDENAEKIHKGMTRAQVTEILGCEPGWYRGPFHQGAKFFFMRSHGRIPELWMSSPNGIAISVYFDDQVVDSVKITHSQPNSDSNTEEHPPIPW